MRVCRRGAPVRAAGWGEALLVPRACRAGLRGDYCRQRRRAAQQQSPAAAVAAATATALPAAAAAAASSPAPPEVAAAAGEVSVVKPFVILTGANFLINASFGAIIPVLPLLAADMHLGAIGVGAILAAPSASRVLANNAMGRAADTHGRLPLMVAGNLLSAASSFGTAAAHTLPALLAARLVNGVGGAAAMAGGAAYMADLTALVPERRAQLLGGQQAAIAIAFVAGPALGGLLADSVGVRPLFVAVGGALCTATLGLLALRPLPQAPAAEGADGGWRELLRDPNQQAVVVMTGVQRLGYTALITVAPLHAAAVWGAGSAQIGLLFSGVSIGTLVGAPIGGYVADRWGRKTGVVPAALLAACGAAVLASAVDYHSFILGMCTWTIGSSILQPGLTALAADAAPPGREGEALALGRQAGDVAFLVGPLFFGFLAEAISEGASLWVMTLCFPPAALFFARRVTPVPPHPHRA